MWVEVRDEFYRAIEDFPFFASNFKRISFWSAAQNGAKKGGCYRKEVKVIFTAKNYFAFVWLNVCCARQSAQCINSDSNVLRELSASGNSIWKNIFFKTFTIFSWHLKIWNSILQVFLTLLVYAFLMFFSKL